MKVSVSENIRLIRESRGFSQDYIAQKLEVTQQAYSQMEKNPDTITLKRLKLLSKILDVNLITLLGEDNTYLQQNYNQSGSNGQFANKMEFYPSDNEKDLYERLINQLKEEIIFLKENIFSKK
jgi:transcriptional regulator with XRE-family HTH domain